MCGGIDGLILSGVEVDSFYSKIMIIGFGRSFSTNKRKDRHGKRVEERDGGVEKTRGYISK